MSKKRPAFLILKTAEGGADLNLTVHVTRDGERRIVDVRDGEEEYASKRLRRDDDSDVGKADDVLPIRVIVVEERDYATKIQPDLEQARALVTRLRRERAANSNYLAQVLPPYLVEQFVETNRLTMFDRAYDEDSFDKASVRIIFDGQVVTFTDDPLQNQTLRFDAEWSDAEATPEDIWAHILFTNRVTRFDDQGKPMKPEHIGFVVLAGRWLETDQTPKELFEDLLKKTEVASSVTRPLIQGERDGLGYGL
jgi:hypothetical protein